MEWCEDKMFIFEKYYNRLEGYDISNHIIDMFDELVEDSHNWIFI